MRKYLKKGCVLCMALILVLGSMTAAFAAPPGSGTSGTPTTQPKGKFEIVSYQIDGNPTYINKGDSFNITVTVKYNSTEGANDFKVKELDITRMVDCFTTGELDAPLYPQKNNQVSGSTFAFDVRFIGVEYKGTGKTFKLMVKKGTEYDPLPLEITECKEYTEPTVEPTPTPTPEAIPAPKVIVTRNELGGDVKAGDELMLTVSVKNIGRTAINNPILSFTPSDSLLVTSNDSALQMNSIGVGRTETAQIKVRVLDPVASVNQ